MASVPELNRLLADLGSRRRRLVELAEPSDLRPEQLVEELNELSQQLILADEELRVQQQELDETREGLLAMSAERDLLLRHSSKAFVVTDEHGVVLQTTRAAQQLIRHPPVRLTPRPIASWFEVDDRRTVRSMIGYARTSGEPQRARARIHVPGEEPLAVELVVERVPDASDGRSLLRWELSPPVQLHAVPSEDVTVPRPAPALALHLASASQELGSCRSRDELVGQILEVALRLVPGAQDAGVVLTGPWGVPRPAAATSPAAGAADRAQVEGQVGPVARALTAATAVASSRLDVELGTRLETGDGVDRPGCAVSMPLVVGQRRLGVLSVYADRPGGLGTDAEVAVTALGKHAALALDRLAEAAGLQEAAGARQLVGQAVGILVERHRLTPEAAFELLATWSQHRNVKLRTLATALVETGQEPPPLPRR